MTKRIIHLLVILLTAGTVYCQPADAPIDPVHFNARLLEHFIKIRIDSVRRLNQLSALSDDSLLYLAAQDQARFLQKQKNLTHDQPGRKKKDPMARAHYYGANYMHIGENIARIYYLVRIKNTKIKGREVFIRTYDEAAAEFVEGWVHSPPHFKNILTGDFDLTGVAISVNPRDKSINAVQVFGKAPEDWKRNPAPFCFPYDR